MNLVHSVITSLSEVDFDDLYERSRSAIDASWPADSPLTDAERKQVCVDMMNSGFNNEWPGLNIHNEGDQYIGIKSVDLDTGKDMSLACGYIIDGDTHDGRHSFSAADENGSRNFYYSEQARLDRNSLYSELGISKILYRNIPTNSVMHRFIKMRAGAGHYTVIEETVNGPVTNIKVELNL